MKRSLIRAFAGLAIVALAACSHSGTQSFVPTPETGNAVSTAQSAQPAPEMAAANSSSGLTFHKACAGAPRPGYSECYALISDTHLMQPNILSAQPNSNCGGPTCYGPADLQKAYNIVSQAASGGKGVTVAIVDAFGYKAVAKDLATFRTQFGLPACSTAPCFRVVNQDGNAGPLPKEDAGWAGEQALDVDMVSAICPNCNILLVQAKTNSNGNLAASVDTAARLGAAVVSNSYGCPETLCGASPTNNHYNHPGTLIVASSGDEGAAAAQPCSLSTVICVGGTSLKKASGARGYAETVWDGLVTHQCSSGPCGTGSGCSGAVSKPSWQNISSVSGCGKRNEVDISAVADPYTGVIIYNGGFGISGGTSASSPIIAAMYALAGDAKTQSGAKLWSHAGKGLNDVVKGTNENAAAGTFMCPASYSYICNARKGYDGPTGWGTPNGLSAL